MKAVLRLGLLVTLVLLGGLIGLKASPHGQVRLATSPWGLFDIGCGALGGLFFGGMIVTFFAGAGRGAGQRSVPESCRTTQEPPAGR